MDALHAFHTPPAQVNIWEKMFHPNVLRMHEAVESTEEGLICLVCDLMLGGELFAQLDRVERFTEQARHVCSACNACFTEQAWAPRP